MVELVPHGRVDPRPLLTHSFLLDNIVEAYALFAHRRDGVLKVAIRPQAGGWSFGLAGGGRLQAHRGLEDPPSRREK